MAKIYLYCYWDPLGPVLKLQIVDVDSENITIGSRIGTL